MFIRIENDTHNINKNYQPEFCSMRYMLIFTLFILMSGAFSCSSVSPIPFMGGGKKYQPKELYSAVSAGDNAKVEQLLRNNANPDERDDATGETAMHAAAYNGRKDLIELLDKYGADMLIQDSNGYIPMTTAVINNQAEIVKYFLDKGIDVNYQNRDGQSPLHLAISSGQVGMVKLLTDRGADVNVKDRNGKTPFFYVVMADNKEIAELLLKKGADINTKDTRDGMTPLHDAVTFNKPGMAQLLLTHNADASLRDKNGRTPLDLAKEQGKTAVEQIIEKHLNQVDKPGKKTKDKGK